MTDVFISYSRENEATARRVARALQGAGLDVWWDADLPAHRVYSEEIERNLMVAKAVVVLWSGAAAQSQWVRAEADVARNGGKLVQALTDGTMPPLPFNQIQCADLKGWRGSPKHPGWAKLAASVEALVSGEAPSRPAVARTARWWESARARWAIAAALLLIAVGIFVGLRYFTEQSDAQPRVAVLPFQSLDQRDASLVGGIWEDTRQALSRNPQLLVLGPNTAQQLAGDPAKARRAADYLVAASVRTVGDRIRVNANLVRTDDDAQLWSESFDRRLDDVFKLQQEIAGEIEGRIRGRLAERGGVRPEHIATTGEVYALYSDARAKVRKRELGSFGQAAEQLRQVVRMDPNFAPGWATLAVIKQFDIEGLEGEDAEADARRAVALAPNLAAAHAALGFVLNKGPAAQASLRRALQLDPNDIEALNWMANSFDDSQTKEKLALYSRVVELEPLWWPAIFNKLGLLFETGSFAAVEQERERVRREGNDSLAAVIQLKLLAEKNDLSGVVDLGLERYKAASGNERELVTMTLYPALLQLGLFELADKIFPPPGTYIPYIRANDPRALDLFEEKFSPRKFWNFGQLPIVGARVYLLNGEGARLARLYRAVAASPAEFESVVDKNAFPDIAPGVALALRSAGDEAQAGALLKLAEARANELHERPLDKQIRLARIYAVQGRKEEAMGQLSSAVRRGWIPPFLPIHTDIGIDPPLRELRADPRFEPLRQQILGYIAKERAELGALPAI